MVSERIVLIGKKSATFSLIILRSIFELPCNNISYIVQYKQSKSGIMLGLGKDKYTGRTLKVCYH